VGPTASGKSALALAVARARAGVELVSADSMTVYRHMDLGTAKPSPAERREVPHHVVDVADPSEEFTVRRYQVEATRALEAVAARRGTPLVVGGTGLYVRAVVDGLDVPGRWPQVARELEATEPGRAGTAALHERLAVLDPVAARRMEPTNRRRIIRALEVTLGSGRPFSSFGPGLGVYPPTPFVLLGLPYDAGASASRIEARFDAMLAAGLLNEVRDLAARPGGLSRTARQALGYRELLSHLEDGVPLAEARAEAVRRTRALARRQWAWFRRDPRIAWLDGAGDLEAQVLEHWDRAAAAPPGPDRPGPARPSRARPSRGTVPAAGARD
jgi:tRNA dimethylallyltransferase